MKSKKQLSLIFSLSALLLLSACDGSDGAGTGADSVPVSFSARVEGTTGAAARAVTPVTGEMTTANIPSMGVYAYYTRQANMTPSHLPNFMNNQRVTKSGSTWTYDPVKYWPGTAGDKISFFAYAPHRDDIYSGLQDAYGLNPANDNDAGIYYTITQGYPKLYYRVPVNEENQVDLLAAPALPNHTRSGELGFKMQHALARVEFRIKSSSDIEVASLAVQDIYDVTVINFDETNNGVPKFNVPDMEPDDPQVDAWACLGYGSTLVDADTDTWIATFYLPARFPEGKLMFEYGDPGSAGNTTNEMELPGEGLWQPGQHVIYTIVIDKTKLDINVTSGNMSWTTGADEIIDTGEPS